MKKFVAIMLMLTMIFTMFSFISCTNQPDNNEDLPNDDPIAPVPDLESDVPVTPDEPIVPDIPDPEPTPDPTPTPDPAPNPDPEPEVPVVPDEPDPTPEPEPDPEPEPEPEIPPVIDEPTDSNNTITNAVNSVFDGSFISSKLQNLNNIKIHSVLMESVEDKTNINFDNFIFKDNVLYIKMDTPEQINLLKDSFDFELDENKIYDLYIFNKDTYMYYVLYDGENYQYDVNIKDENSLPIDMTEITNMMPSFKDEDFDALARSYAESGITIVITFSSTHFRYSFAKHWDTIFD